MQLLQKRCLSKMMKLTCRENYVKFIDGRRIFIRLLLDKFIMLGNCRKTTFIQLFKHRGPNNIFIPLWLDLNKVIANICDNISDRWGTKYLHM